MKVIRLGRAGDNDYIVSNPAVSGHHADIYVYDNGAIQYMDHSTNGTYIGGVMVHNSGYVLNGSEMITLPGNISVRVQDIVSIQAKGDMSKADDVFYNLNINVSNNNNSNNVNPEVNKQESSYVDYQVEQPMFSNLFSFQGRIRRLEYNLINLGISFGYPFFAILMFVSESVVLAILFLLSVIPTCWISWASAVKRSHDIGNSGWFILIPFYGFALIFANSNRGTNMYGPNPKGIN